MTKIILRINSPQGRSRIEISNEVTISDLLSKLAQSNQFDSASTEAGVQLKPSSAPISSILSHGSTITLHSSPENAAVKVDDSLDAMLDAMDGKIKRSRDPVLYVLFKTKLQAHLSRNV